MKEYRVFLKLSFNEGLSSAREYGRTYSIPVAGVSGEPFSQLTPLSGVAELHTVHVGWNRVHPSYVAWKAGMATPLSWLG